MSSTNRFRVMLVDDHPIMRRGLRVVLEESGPFEVVAQAADGEEAVMMAEESRPDVIVMDIIMPRKDGVESCRDILDLLPEARVLMLTASTEEDAVMEAIAAGARGFVQKYSGRDELVEAVRRVAEGRLIIPEDAVTRVFRLFRRGTAQMPARDVLSAREQDVLALFCRGKTYSQIAEALGLSRFTVRSVIYRVQDKLEVKSKQEIVVWAVRNGLADDVVVGAGAQPTENE